VVFDYVGIQLTVSRLEKDHRRWEQFFRQNGIEPLVIIYEELLEDREATVRKILRHLEVPETEALALRTGLNRRQDNRVNQQWIERFKTIQAKGRLYRFFALVLGIQSLLIAMLLRWTHGKVKHKPAHSDKG
jgi:LPS sulfotransferase NodH